MNYYPDERLWNIQRRGGFSEISTDNYASGYWENYRFDDCVVQINCGWGEYISIPPRLLASPTDEEKQYLHWIGLRAIELNKMSLAASITNSLEANKRPLEDDDLQLLQAFITSPIAAECRESFVKRVTALIAKLSAGRNAYALHQIAAMADVSDDIKSYIASVLEVESDLHKV